MTFDLSAINWLAVIVGTIIYFGLGAVWYSPMLFAKPWQRSIGWDPEQSPPEQRATTYVVPFFAYLVMAIAIAMIANAIGADDFGDGIVLGLVMGVGFAAMHSVVDATFDPNRPQPWTWFAITASYNLIGFLVLGVIISIWS